MELKGVFLTEADGFSFLKTDGTEPPGADLCLVIREKCMSPWIKAGERVYVSTRQQLAEFDTGIFYYKGRVYCRQWCEDYSGALHLLSATGEAELSLDRQQRKACLCLGKVLLDKQPPRPLHF